MPYFQDKNGSWRYVYSYHRNYQVIFTRTPEEKAVNIVKLFNFIISNEGSRLTELGIEGQHYSIDSSGEMIIKDMSADEQAKIGWRNYYLVMRRSLVPPDAPRNIRNFLLNELSFSHAIESPIQYGRIAIQYGSSLSSLGISIRQS